MGVDTRSKGGGLVALLTVAAIAAGGIFMVNNVVSNVNEDNPEVSWIARGDVAGDITFHLVSNIDGVESLKYNSTRKTGAITLKRGELLKIEVEMIITPTETKRNIECKIMMNGGVLDQDQQTVHEGSRRSMVVCAATARRG